MQLEPRYGPVVFTMDLAFPHPGEAFIGQRQRLLEMLAVLDPEAWGHPTRCATWSVRDVVAHLVTVDGFWSASLQAGLAGEPTRMLDGFDPARHPDRLVAQMGPVPPEELLARFQASSADLCELVAGLTPEGWSSVAEAPVGHVTVDRVVEHALWDAWVHEHDIRGPLGLPPAGAPGELATCLRYAAALGPAMGGIGIDGFTGTVAVEATDPEVVFAVEVSTVIAVLHRAPGPATPTLRGSTIELIDALSLRRPLPADAPPEWHDMLGGLARAFDPPT